MKKRYKLLTLAMAAVMLLGSLAGCGKTDKTPDFTPLEVETYSFLPELQWGMSPEQAVAALGKPGITLADMELSSGSISTPEKEDKEATDVQISYATLGIKDLELLDHAAEITLVFGSPTPEPALFLVCPEGDRSMGLIAYTVTFPLAERENYNILMDAVEGQGVSQWNTYENFAGTTLDDLPNQEMAAATESFLQRRVRLRYEERPDDPVNLSSACATLNKTKELNVYCNGLVAAGVLYMERLDRYRDAYIRENPDQTFFPTGETARWPVFDRTQYGMSPEEVREAEGLSEGNFVLDDSQWDDSVAIYRAKQKAFGADADVGYLFNVDNDLGLVRVQIVFREELSGSGKEEFDALMGNTQGITADQLTQEEQAIFIPAMTKLRNEWAKGVDTVTEESVGRTTMAWVTPNSAENSLNYDGGFAAWLVKFMDEKYSRRS